MRNAIHNQYPFEPLKIFSSTRTALLKHIKNTGAGTQMSKASYREAPLQQLPYLRAGVIQIATDESSLGGFNAVGHQSLPQALNTKGAFLYHTLLARRILRVYLIQKGSWVNKIKAASIVGAGGHAKPTTDTTMIIHVDYAIFSLKGCLGGTDAYARGILAMITQYGDA
jgi:hypothetical protein